MLTRIDQPDLPLILDADALTLVRRSEPVRRRQRSSTNNGPTFSEWLQSNNLGTIAFRAGFLITRSAAAKQLALPSMADEDAFTETLMIGSNPTRGWQTIPYWLRSRRDMTLPVAVSELRTESLYQSKLGSDQDGWKRTPTAYRTHLQEIS